MARLDDTLAIEAALVEITAILADVRNRGRNGALKANPLRRVVTLSEFAKSTVRKLINDELLDENPVAGGLTSS